MISLFIAYIQISKPVTAKAVYSSRKSQGQKVDRLINTAGFDYYSSIADTDPNYKHAKPIHLVLRLCHNKLVADNVNSFVKACDEVG